MARYQQNNLHGISLMIIGMLLMSIMDAVAKWLVLADISAVQVIAVRSWFIVILVLLISGLHGQLSELKTKRPLHHALRGLAAFLAPVTFFTALKTLPLADATVVFFSATFVMTAASALILKEQVGRHRWSAVIVGFIGVVIAINPQGGGDLFAYLLVLVSTLTYAAIFISGKHLTSTDSVLSLVFSVNLGMGIVATALLPWFWVPLTLSLLGKIFLMAVVAMTGHYAIGAAFARADISAIAPFEYTALLWTTIIGYLVWMEIPAVRVWFGALIIISSGLYVIHRESLRRSSEPPV